MKNDLAQAYLLINRGETRAKPLVGISACLCGDRVRYDGREKGFPDLVAILEKQLELLNVCPEVAIGMGVPRPPIQLTLNQGVVEARGVTNPSHDVTTALQDYAQLLIKGHSPFNSGKNTLCGFILKSRSPSCGVGSTPMYKNNHPVGFGSGIFSQQLQQQLPWLPIAEEESLLESEHQQNFVMRSQLVQLFWQITLEKKSTIINFHKQISALLKLLPTSLNSELMQLASNSDDRAPQHYLTRLMQALQTAPQQD